MITGFQEEGAKFRDLTVATGVTEVELNDIQPLPACRAYTDFLLRVAYQGTPEEFASAMTSCPWTYAGSELGGLHIGPRMAHALETYYGVPSEIAQHYGENFLGGIFEQSLQQFIDLISHDIDRITDEEKKRRHDLFQTGSNYEYKFWQMAYEHVPDSPTPASFYTY